MQNGIVSAVLAGAAPLYKTNPGTVTLTASNTLTSVTVIEGGTLSISSDDNLGTAPVFATPNSIQLNGGALQTTAGFTLNSNRGIALGPTASGSGAGTIDVSSGTTLTYNGVIANNGTGGTTGSLVKTGTGTLILGSNNTYTGTTTIRQGTLSAANIVVSGGHSSLGNATSAVALGGLASVGTLSYTGGTATYTRGFSVASAVPGGGLAGVVEVTTAGQALTIGTKGITTAGTLAIGGAGDTIVTSVVGGGPGAGGLAKTGTGTLTLTEANTYGGATTVSGGMLRNGVANALPTGTALTVTGTGTLDLAGFAQQVASLSDNGSATGTVTDTDASATLTVADAGSHTFAGTISGPLSLALTGTGTVTLAGANTYAGTTSVSRGTLRLGASNALPDTTDVSLGVTPGILAGLDIGAFSDTIHSLALVSGSVAGTSGALTSQTDFDVRNGSIAATLAGGVGLVKSTGGVVTITSANNFTGPTTVSGGALVIAADAAFGTAPGVATPGHLTVEGATLQTTASFALAANRGIAIGPASGTGGG